MHDILEMPLAMITTESLGIVSGYDELENALNEKKYKEELAKLNNQHKVLRMRIRHRRDLAKARNDK